MEWVEEGVDVTYKSGGVEQRSAVVDVLVNGRGNGGRGNGAVLYLIQMLSVLHETCLFTFVLRRYIGGIGKMGKFWPFLHKTGGIGNIGRFSLPILCVVLVNLVLVQIINIIMEIIYFS